MPKAVANDDDLVVASDTDSSLNDSEERIKNTGGRARTRSDGNSELVVGRDGVEWCFCTKVAAPIQRDAL